MVNGHFIRRLLSRQTDTHNRATALSGPQSGRQKRVMDGNSEGSFNRSYWMRCGALRCHTTPRGTLRHVEPFAPQHATLCCSMCNAIASVRLFVRLFPLYLRNRLTVDWNFCVRVGITIARRRLKVRVMGQGQANDQANAVGPTSIEGSFF